MALSFSGLLAGALAVLLVFVALGMVIFVHELGHFLVAKLCGVKVEKFYLGFDIFGWRVLRFRFGQTEYGVGILPLGGYVKMLGQEDNPARLREEIERARRELVSRAASQSELEVLKEAESAESVVCRPLRCGGLSPGSERNACQGGRSSLRHGRLAGGPEAR